MNIKWEEAPKGYSVWIEGLFEYSCLEPRWYKEEEERYTAVDGRWWGKNQENIFYVVHRKPKE